MIHRRLAMTAWLLTALPLALFAQPPGMTQGQPMKDRMPPIPTPSDQSAIQAGGDNPVFVIQTTKGNIKIQLDAKKAPVTVANFARYVSEGFYKGTIFHRVIESFMIQGGGFTKDMQQKPTHDAIKNEADNGLKNLRGTLAMARTSVPDSATAQFFINLVDNSFLDFQGKSPDKIGYCVFGKVIDGMNIVDIIKSVPTGNHGPFQNVPNEPVEIIDIVADTGGH